MSRERCRVCGGNVLDLPLDGTPRRACLLCGRTAAETSRVAYQAELARQAQAAAVARAWLMGEEGTDDAVA